MEAGLLVLYAPISHGLIKANPNIFWAFQRQWGVAFRRKDPPSMLGIS
jgi:hypothetical protein